MGLKFARYKKVVAFIKKECPTAFPISVKVVPMKTRWAECEKKKNKFIVRVPKHVLPNSYNEDYLELVEQFMIDAFLHEYAHALAWNHIHDKLEGDDFFFKVHGPEWGVAYSQVYQKYSQADEAGEFNI